MVLLFYKNPLVTSSLVWQKQEAKRSETLFRSIKSQLLLSRNEEQKKNFQLLEKTHVYMHRVSWSTDS